jgi:CubicO group peptidase (beta-lactamase class C family)
MTWPIGSACGPAMTGWRRPWAHLRAAPGREFTYNSGCSHLLSVILTHVTGDNLDEFAAERLFAPLQIAAAPWLRDPQGYCLGAVGLALSARDLAKIGYLYLLDGRWGDRDIVPRDFVRQATTRKNDGGFPEDVAYGYHWWVTRIAGHPAFFAAGYGGQYLYVVPDLELIVVTTAHWQASPEDLFEPRPVIEEVIVPAVR